MQYSGIRNTVVVKRAGEEYQHLLDCSPFYLWIRMTTKDHQRRRDVLVLPPFTYFTRSYDNLDKDNIDIDLFIFFNV